MEPFEFDNFLEIFPPKNGMATNKQLKELLEFIGGFEKWSMLNEDCRREVVKYLDFKSRFNLGICSKDDHETVEKTKIYAKSVEIQDTGRRPYLISKENNVVVRIQFHSGKHIELFFSQLAQDTRVQWLRYIPDQCPVLKEVIWKSSNYYEEAVKFAEKWMKKSNFELEEIKVEMKKYPFESSQIKSLPCCKKVRICAVNVDSFKWWLEKCPERLDKLQLDVHSEVLSFTLPSDFLNAPQVMLASGIFFDFSCRAAFSDEQLLKLHGKTMSIVSKTVTDKGINEFLKNWVHGKGVDGFKSFHLWNTNARDLDVMLAGLEYVEWDETFENEQWYFVDRFDRSYDYIDWCYQIKSKVDRFESLTLGIDDDRVAIVATGKRAENNGEAYTLYRLP
ncbi:unnamed protein product [Caenorhabditis brenneri]